MPDDRSRHTHFDLMYGRTPFLILLATCTYVHPSLDFFYLALAARPGETTT